MKYSVPTARRLSCLLPIVSLFYASHVVAETASESGDDGFKLLAGILAVAAAAIVLITNIVQWSRVRKDVKELKVVVKDTKEIRDALAKSFEGDWNVQGKFEKFQGQSIPHYSTGLASFSWSPEENSYNINYVYSVRKEKSVQDEITCFSRGILSADYDGRISPKDNISINFEIHSRTCTADYEAAEAKHFALENGKFTTNPSGRPTQLEFKLDRTSTSGVVKFVR